MDIGWFRIKGTVITNIYWQVALVTLYAAGIVVLNSVLNIPLNFPMSLISVIGVVVGLLLAFRTNSAYDRYWEGRKLWSTMTLQVRTITRCIWIGVKGNQPKDLMEKKSAINLAVAFVIATKHYLRDEYSYDSEDIKSLINHLPRLSTPSSNLPLLSQSVEDIPHEEGTNSICKSKESMSVKSGGGGAKPNKLMAYDHPVPTNIPIELSYYILSYIAYIQENSLAESYIISSLSSALTSMVDCLTSFERILRTPIPMAYSVHLHHSVWLYLLSLPYQLLGAHLNWWTIPIVGLGSFCLLGILSIGWEIENPFGYDANDLPLDDFCQVIRREVDVITSQRLPTAQEWLHSPRNLPFGSRYDINATELCERTIDEVELLLLRNACPSHWIKIQK